MKERMTLNVPDEELPLNPIPDRGGGNVYPTVEGETLDKTLLGWFSTRT